MDNSLRSSPISLAIGPAFSENGLGTGGLHLCQALSRLYCSRSPHCIRASWTDLTLLAQSALYSILLATVLTISSLREIRRSILHCVTLSTTPIWLFARRLQLPRPFFPSCRLPNSSPEPPSLNYYPQSRIQLLLRALMEVPASFWGVFLN